MKETRNVKLEEISGCVDTAVEIYFPDVAKQRVALLTESDFWKERRAKFENKLKFFLKDEIGVDISLKELQEIVDYAYSGKMISKAVFYGLYPEHKKLLEEIENEIKSFVSAKEDAAYGGMVGKMTFFSDYFWFHEGLDRGAAHQKYLQMENNNRAMNSIVPECYRGELTKKLEEKYGVSLEGLVLTNATAFAEAVAQKKFDN